MVFDPRTRQRGVEEKSLATYYREVERHPQITAQEEQALAARIETGDKQALEQLGNANFQFVIHVAMSFRNQGLSMADLINEVNLGLLTAARKSNRSKGYKFITCAVWWIRQNILKALEVQTLVQAGLDQGLERDPLPEEVAAEIDIPLKKLAYTLGEAPNAVSLDTPLYGDEDGSLLDSLPDPHTPLPDDTFLQNSLLREINVALSALSDRDQQILSLCFGIGGDEPATYQQIGAQFGISRERVR